MFPLRGFVTQLRIRASTRFCFCPPAGVENQTAIFPIRQLTGINHSIGNESASG